MTIPVNVSMVSIGPGGVPIYRMSTKGSKNLSEADILQRLSQKSGLDVTKNRFWMDVFRDVLFQSLSSNETLDLGFMYAKLYPTGTIPSLTAQPTPEANPVKGRIYFKGEFAEKLAAIGLVNETQTVNLILYEVKQDGVRELNRIESTTARVVMNLNCGKIDAAQADNGVWLEDAKTGARLAGATVSYSDSSTCYVTFPTLPPSGRHRLVIATRNGEDPTAYVLARATRLVDVVNGEEVSRG